MEDCTSQLDHTEIPQVWFGGLGKHREDQIQWFRTVGLSWWKWPGLPVKLLIPPVLRFCRGLWFSLKYAYFNHQWRLVPQKKHSSAEAICFLFKQNWTTYLNIQAAKQATVDITAGLSNMPQWTTRWMMSWWNCQGHWQVAMWHYFWILLDFMRAPRWIGKKVPWSRFDYCRKKLWKGGILGRGRALVWNFQRIETFDIDFVIGCFWYFWKLEHVWCIV